MVRTHGFTLLEVLIAVSVLGLGLTMVLSAQAGLFSSAAHAENLGPAVGLARCKMSEIELELRHAHRQSCIRARIGHI